MFFLLIILFSYFFNINVRTIIKLINIYETRKNIFEIILFSVLIIIITAPQCIGQEKWEPVKIDNNNDIKIYYKSHDSGNIEFRGITHIKCSLNSLVSLFSDSESMPNWVYRLQSVERLKEIKDTEVFVYTIHSMPWPFKLRDSVVHSILKQDPQSKVVTIHGKAAPDFVDKKKEYVRITVVESTWKFKPYNDNTVEVVFQGYGEPGGEIISSIYRSPVFHWLVELYLWQLPYQTLFKMKDYIKLPKYQNRTNLHIKEIYN